MLFHQTVVSDMLYSLATCLYKSRLVIGVEEMGVRLFVCVSYFELWAWWSCRMPDSSKAVLILEVL